MVLSRSCIAASLLLIGTCTGVRKDARLETRSFADQGHTRTYHVYAPPGHDPKKPVPLVIALHGGGGNGLKYDAFTNGQMTSEAEVRGWVVAFPEGIAKGWNDGRHLETRRDEKRAGIDDVAFIGKLIDRMHAEYGIDTDRVYVTGISNGGFMSTRLGIELSDRIAAIGVVAAQLQEVHRDKTPKAPVSVLIMNGTADPLVPYVGGDVEVLGKKRGRILSTKDTIAWWVGHDGCEGEPMTSSLPDRVSDDGASIEVTAYDDCKDGTSVVLYRVNGGGHTWPGGMQYLPKNTVGTVCRDISAAHVIFDFFEQHSREHDG